MHIYVGYEDAADKKYFYRAIAEIKKLDRHHPTNKSVIDILRADFQ